MHFSKVDRNYEAGSHNAPDVGAFYFEDALELFEMSGRLIGRVEFTLPPRQSGEAANLSDLFNRRDNSRPYEPLRRILEPRKYRVVRCTANGCDQEGNPVYDLLLTTARAMPPAVEEP